MKTRHLLGISTVLVVGIAIASSVSMFIPDEQVAKAGFLINDPEYSNKYIFELKAGESKESKILITNTSDVPQTMNIYAADGINTAEGNFTIKTNLEEQSALGTWINFEKPKYELDAKESIEIPFTLTVPDNIAPGTYGGGIAVSAKNSNKLVESSKKQENNTQFGYTVVSRKIITMVVTIPGEKNHNYEWSRFEYTPTSSTIPSFNFEFKNLGNTMVVVDGEIELRGGLFNSNSDDSKLSFNDVTIFQKDTLAISRKWDKSTLMGSYTAEARITFWEYDIVQGKKISANEITKTIHFNVIPWTQIIVVFGTILLLVGLLVFIAYRHNKIINSCKLYEIQNDETIESIAKKFGMKWEKLAKLNKLKAPYGLTKKKKLLIPPKEYSKCVKNEKQ